MKVSWGSRSNLALFLLAFLSLLTFYSACYSGRAVTLERTFRLTIKVIYENRSLNETWFLCEDDFTIGLFMNNSWQEVYLVSTSHPIKGFYNDSDGNRVTLLNVGEMKVPPSGSVSYNVTYRLIFRERDSPAISEEESGDLDDIPQELREKYCKPTTLWQSNLTALKHAAQNIISGERKVLTILKKFIIWITSNIHYATLEVPRYPNETISQRLGDCDDQANLLITFCRAVGIPAYLQVGCIYMPWLNRSLSYWSSHLLIKEEGVGWHGWAVVYVPPWGWLPVDLTYVSGDLRLNPLNAIICSAAIESYTFQYLNITVTDYISETRSMKNLLESGEFYIYEEDVMKFEERVICPKLPIIAPVHPVTLISELAAAVTPWHKRLPHMMRIVYMLKSKFLKIYSRGYVGWRSLR